MQVLGFVLFAVTRILASFFELKIHAHKTHKKGALFFTYTSFKATVSGGTKTFQKQKPCVSDDAVPAEHAGNDDDDDDDGLLERRWRRETTPGATTLCFVFFRVPTFFFAFFVSREREKVYIDR